MPGSAAPSPDQESGRRAALSFGLVPRYLSREDAASYLGVGVDTFDEEVAAGQWPQPRRRGAKGGRVTWDRALLDLYADSDSGLASRPLPDAPRPGEAPPETPVPGADDVQATAEQAALQKVRDAKARHRTQQRQPHAA